jgi:L-ascorbate metabolism protein UlaG (beta-lactamase superfamily)
MTHYGHACVLVEDDRSRFLFDPGMFSSGLDDVTDLAAVVVTHQHPDHLDEALLGQLLTRSPDATLVVDPGSAAVAARITDRLRVVSAGERLEVAGRKVASVGGDHAVVHPDMPPIPNIGFMLDDGAFYHPGDAFDVPQQPIDVLGLPVAAPWLKASEVVDFLRAVSPRVAVPIHEAVLARPELQWPLYRQLAPETTEFRPLERGEAEQV